jgi:hypothetical protein
MMKVGHNRKALEGVPGEAQADGFFTWELAQLRLDTIHMPSSSVTPANTE